MENPNVQQLKDKMMARPSRHLVCNESTDLVIEGYPRSGNTFTVDMISVLSGGKSILKLAHHTHSIENLMLADAYGIPKLVLIRSPVDAILSFHIFSQRDIEFCINRYINFYTGVCKFQNEFHVADFFQITEDFNSIVEKINLVVRTPIPISADLKADTEKAFDRARARAAGTHGEGATRRVGVPNEDREAMKVALREKVVALVGENSVAEDLYRKVKAKGLPDHQRA